MGSHPLRPLVCLLTLWLLAGLPSLEASPQEGDGSASPAGAATTGAPQEKEQGNGDEQAAKDQASEPSGEGEGSVTPLETLEALRENLVVIAKQREELTQELSGDVDAETKESIQAQIRQTIVEEKQLESNFQAIATGLDVESILAPPAKSFDIQQELESLIRPLIEEMKTATEGPRQTEDLRSTLNTQREKEKAAEQGKKSITAYLESVPPGSQPELRRKLEESFKQWEQERKQAASARKVAQYRLDELEKNRSSVLESSREFLDNFFRTRGLNLLLAVLAFLVVFFGLRWAYRLIIKAFPQRSAHRPMHRRLIEVLVHGFAGLAALAASLIVLSAAGDWVLLGLVILLMLGVAWASKMAIPQYLAEIRMLLNLGTVREAERVVYNGLPYRVSRLGIQTHLTNPALEGGFVRLPVRDLIDMRSRPIAPGDLWFPCRLEDYVLLSDGQRGQVIKLTPEMVRISLLGGSELTYTTSDFLSLSPENISRDFRMFVTFGIDYAHQSIATTEVPPKMKTALADGLAEIVDPGDINSVKVEFKEAAASSLDYAIMIDFGGDMAARYAMLNRAIQRILVDLCNQEGWGIPFAQIVVHKAEAAE